ncbi:unnamed protein product [Amoebophrya sp. A25]|nr:unnamed protein product [Amoebophrya sp. A25]|eukprot:GSA25T00012271001.1
MPVAMLGGSRRGTICYRWCFLSQIRAANTSAQRVLLCRRKITDGPRSLERSCSTHVVLSNLRQLSPSKETMLYCVSAFVKPVRVCGLWCDTCLYGCGIREMPRNALPRYAYDHVGGKLRPGGSLNAARILHQANFGRNCIVCTALLLLSAVVPYAFFSAVCKDTPEEELLFILSIVSPLLSMVAVVAPMVNTVRQLRSFANPYQQVAAFAAGEDLDELVDDGNVEQESSVPSLGRDSTAKHPGAEIEMTAPTRALGLSSARLSQGDDASRIRGPEQQISENMELRDIGQRDDRSGDEEERTQILDKRGVDALWPTSTEGTEFEYDGEDPHASLCPVASRALAALGKLPVTMFRTQLVCAVLGVSYGIQVRSEPVVVNNMVQLLFLLFYLSVVRYLESFVAISASASDSVDSETHLSLQEEMGEFSLNEVDSPTGSITTSGLPAERVDEDDAEFRAQEASNRLFDQGRSFGDGEASADSNSVVPTAVSATQIGRQIGEEPHEVCKNFDIRQRKNTGAKLVRSALTGSDDESGKSKSWRIGFVLSFSMRLGLVLFICVNYCSLLLVGIAIIASTVFLNLAPLIDLPRVIQSRDPASLDASICVIYLMSNGVWSLYGLILEDFVVLLPSVVSYVLSAFQMLLILWTRRARVTEELCPLDMGFLLALFRVVADALPWGSRGTGEEEDEFGHSERNASQLPYSFILTRRGSDTTAGGSKNSADPSFDRIGSSSTELSGFKRKLSRDHNRRTGSKSEVSAMKGGQKTGHIQWSMPSDQEMFASRKRKRARSKPGSNATYTPSNATLTPIRGISKI